MIYSIWEKRSMRKDDSTAQAAIPPGSTTTVMPVAPANVLAAPTPAAIRNEMTDTVIRDLLSPEGRPEEELDQTEDNVYARYPVRMLTPHDNVITWAELGGL